MKQAGSKILITCAVAVATLVFFAWQKLQEPQDDEIDRIIKTYFLPDDDRQTVERSFSLCESNNGTAIENLYNIYGSKSKEDLQNAIDKIAHRFEGNIESRRDVRTEKYAKEADKWTKQIENKISPDQLAYEFAFFQHRIYLQYTDSIRPGMIRDLYKMAKSKEVDGCLVKNAKIAQKDHPDKKSGPLKKGKENSIKEKSEEEMMSNWTFKNAIIGILLILFLIWESRQSFKHLRLAGRGVIRFFQKLNIAFESGTPFYVKQNSQIVEDALQTEQPQQSAPAVPKGETPRKKTRIRSRTATKAAPIPKPQLLYARLPSGGYFYQFSKIFEPNETFFVLSIFPDDPITASVSLTDNAETRDYLFTRMPYQEACDLLGIGIPTMANIREVEPGKARLFKEMWIMQSKIKIDW